MRLLPYSSADGPHNMAADEILLEAATAGTASLRFYGWTEATLSLGYFQPQQTRHNNARLAALPFVRRPSGGGALVHHHEVTYALALPAGPPWQMGASWLCRMHDIVATALATLGVGATACASIPPRDFPGWLCFQHCTPGDLVIAAAKVAGSAQRRQRGALLQHGALLIAASPFAPILPGIRELTGLELSEEAICRAVVQAFSQSTGRQPSPAPWTAKELERIEDVVHAKYTQNHWNCKR